MNEYQKFQNERNKAIKEMGQDIALREQAINFARDTAKYGYSYNFEWMKRPIIQFPQDMIAMQEIILEIKPDLIIETGIAHGGSLVMSASMLALLDLCDAIEFGVKMDPRESKRRVLGIDIDIREHNRIEIENHPMASRIQMIQGSSIAPEVVDQVLQVAKDYERILVCLDSNHTHEHVLAELHAYAQLATVGSYCVVFDTLVEDMPAIMFPNRPWGSGNNPKTAVWEFLKTHPEFKIDKSIDHRLLISVAPDGYLKRIA